MKIKNTSSTIISIGSVVVLPDDTVEISDKAYQNNDVINFLVGRNRLAIVKERAAKAAEPAAEDAVEAEKPAKTTRAKKE